MRSFFLAMLLFLLLALPPVNAAAQMPTHLDSALTYVGTVEHGQNHGPAIDRFLIDVHLAPGNPYCAAFVSYSLDAAGNVVIPRVRSGLAHNFIIQQSIPARKVLRGTVRIPIGTILVWQKGNTMFGHTGLVIVWAQSEGITVEANTSPGKQGNQREGDGVWIRHRSIQPASYFRIVDFTPVLYKGQKFSDLVYSQ